MSAYDHSLPTPLRKVAAVHDLPSLATPGRISNPSSYPFQRPPPGARIPDESPLPLTSTRDPPKSFCREVKQSVEDWLSGIAEADHHEMMHRWSEKHAAEPASPGGSPRTWIPVSRRGSWMLTPRKFALIFGTCLGILVLNSFMSGPKHHEVILSHFALFPGHLVC